MVESTLPPITTPGNRRSLKILEALLANTMVMHQFYHQNEDQSVKVIGFMITIASDSADGTGKDLFIYSLYGYEKVSLSDIFSALALIKVYAKSEGCNAVTGLTNVPQLIQYVKRIGGVAEYTFVKWEV
jgi:hypothetical protein